MPRQSSANIVGEELLLQITLFTKQDVGLYLVELEIQVTKKKWKLHRSNLLKTILTDLMSLDQNQKNKKSIQVNIKVQLIINKGRNYLKNQSNRK